MEDVLNVIGKLVLYLVTILCGLLIHSLVLLPLVFFVITRNNPYRFMKGVGDALMTAFGIASRFVACICEHMHVKLTQSNYSQTAPEMIPKPEIIDHNSTPIWLIPTPLVTSTPKWSPLNHWNEMVFHHGIITTLLQRVRSWIAFNIHYFLAVLSSNRLSVYFCIFNIILKM